MPLLLRRLVFALLLLALPVSATADESPASRDVPKLSGEIVGISHKAEVITLRTENGVEIVFFSPETEGLEYAQKGETVVIHSIEENGHRMARAIGPFLAELPPGATAITVEELQKLLDENQAEEFLLVDSRSTGRYDEGHIPTARPLPHLELLEKGATLLPSNRDTLLVFYCEGETCCLSTQSAALALELGYRRVRVLLEGAAAWRRAGLLLAASDAYVSAGNHLLIDLRPRAAAENGHIPGAVSLPLADLVDAELDFPTRKDTPIVLYGDKADLSQAVELIEGWGFGRLTIVEGGLAGWQAREKPLAHGPLDGSLRWTPSPGPGEIGLDEFKTLMGNPAATAVVLDVRTATERAAGHLPGSLHIPLNELPDRVDEIPAGHEILVHCTSGVRAEMAHAYLQPRVESIRFLNARVQCKGEVCTVR